MDMIAVFTRSTSKSTTRIRYFLKQDLDRKEWIAWAVLSSGQDYRAVQELVAA
jgi:hypothetical protein